MVNTSFSALLVLSSRRASGSALLWCILMENQNVHSVGRFHVCSCGSLSGMRYLWIITCLVE
jgi:hypothetical protein